MSDHEATCGECGGPAVENPRTGTREPRMLCGNPKCHMCDQHAEKDLLIRAVLVSAHEWRHVSDDATRGEDEAELGHAEESLAHAIDALTTRFPGAVHI